MLPKFKIHIIYLSIIVLLVVLLQIQHKEVTKIVTQTKTLDHVLVQNKIKYVDRIVTVKKPTGEVIIMSEHVTNEDSSVLQDKLRESNYSKVTSNAPNYMLSALYPVTLAPLNPMNLLVIGGIRLASTPIFLNVGTTGKFNQVTVGITLEL